MSLNNERLSDNILKKFNRAYDAKLTDSLKEDEFTNIIIDLGTMFANLVKKGIKTEEDVMSFETLIPSEYSKALNTVKEGNTDALMQMNSWFTQSSPVKGLRR